MNVDKKKRGRQDNEMQHRLYYAKIETRKSRKLSWGLPYHLNQNLKISTELLTCLVTEFLAPYGNSLYLVAKQAAKTETGTSGVDVCMTHFTSSVRNKQSLLTINQMIQKIRPKSFSSSASSV